MLVNLRFTAAVPVIAIGTVLLAPSNAMAQTPSDGAVGGLEEVTVTARRVEENLQRVPVAVTAISEATLDRLSVREMRDISSIAPNLNIKQSSNDGQAALVAIRGQVPAGVLLTTDSAVGIYVDGINIPRPNGFRAALVDVSRVEVLRGPQGTLYGRNTTGGAISVITNSPTDVWEGSVRLRGGNYGAVNGVGVLNVPISDGLAARFVAQRGSHDGYGTDFNGKDLADEDSTYLRGKLRAERGSFTAELSADYQSSNTGGPIWHTSGLTQFTTPVGGSATREVAQELGLPQNAVGWDLALQQLLPYVYRGHGDAYRSGQENSFSNFHTRGVSLDMTWEISDNYTLRSLSGYRKANRHNVLDLEGTPYDILVIDIPVEDEVYSQEVQLLGDAGPVSYVVGVFGSYEDGFETSAVGTVAALNAAGGRPFFATQGGFVTSSSYAVFGQANWSVTDQLTFTLGARYTTDKKELESISHNNPAFRNRPLPAGVTTGCLVPVSLLDSPSNCRATLEDTYSDPSWLISADYKLTDETLVYGKVARGFRAGGQNLRGLNLVALQSFDPETITEYEIGIKANLWDRRARINLAVFHDDYDGVQRTVSLTFGSTLASLVSNAAKAQIDGVEVEIVLQPIDSITLSANVGYIDARYDEFIDSTGDRSNEDWPTPDLTYAVSARYALTLGADELSFQADYQGQSEQNMYPAVARQPDEVTQKAYGLLNGRISYEVRKYDLEVALFGHNLLDKVYAESALSSEALGANFISIGEPRTYGLEVVKQF